MYICQLCGTQVPRGTPQRKLITKRRPQVYTQTWVRVRNTEAHRLRIWRELPRSKDGGRKKGKPRFIEIAVPKHIGWEIAEEKRVCPKCAKRPSTPIPKQPIPVEQLELV
jgi:hypothetical protein